MNNQHNDPWNNSFNPSNDPPYYSTDNPSTHSIQKQTSFYDNPTNPTSILMASVGRKASLMFDSEMEASLMPSSDTFYSNHPIGMGRHRAETISFTRPFNLNQDVNLLNSSIPTNGTKQPSRHRSGSLNLPNKGGLNEAFGHSLFGNSWEPQHVNHNSPMSLVDPSSFIQNNPSPPLLLQQQKNSLINAFDASAQSSFQSPPIIQGESHSAETVTRALDYLGLDDPNQDMYSPVSDPFAQPFTQQLPSVSQRSMGHARVRSYSSAISSLQPNKTITSSTMVSFSQTGRPRSFTIPAKDGKSFALQEALDDFVEPLESSQRTNASGAYSDDSHSLDLASNSKSLWIGNLDSSITPQDLLSMFTPFGPVESFRLFPDRDSAFINFMMVEDAVRAKESLQGCFIGNSPIRIGFGRSDASSDGQGSQPTKSLWIGNLSSSIDSIDLEKLFSNFGQIESARVLSHKNCGFVNFIRIEDAIEARKHMHSKEIAGSVIKIGFAKVPSVRDGNPVSINTSQVPMEWQDSSNAPYMSSNTPSYVPWESTFEYTDIYANSIPSLPDSKVDSNRLKDFRKRLEGNNLTADHLNEIFRVVIKDAVCISADYIGNVIVQKLIEKGSDEQRLALIKEISPYMAAIGIHKNGTWAVQKMLDLANTSAQIQGIVDAINPYTPSLLLDQFGNYVVQCCLRFDNNQNQFIFDAIVARFLEISCGRFGARSIRTCLESQYTTKRQQKQVATAILQYGAQLALDPNGSLLIGWLLDMSTLPGRFRAIVPVFTSHLVMFCTHKLASASILKILNQRIELDARDVLLKAIFSSENPTILYEILSDQNVGIGLIRKIVGFSCLNAEEQSGLCLKIQQACIGHADLKNNQGFKRLLEEISNGGIPSTPSSVSNDLKKEDAVSPLTTPKSSQFRANSPGNINGIVYPTPKSTPQH